MINLNYDQDHNAVIIEFVGAIDAAQGDEYLPRLGQFIPSAKGFNLLVDLTAVESMDRGIHGTIKKAMDLFNVRGVAKIVRVIPDPGKDIGLNIMSVFHYESSVRILTVSSRQEAWERLKNKRSVSQ